MPLAKVQENHRKKQEELKQKKEEEQKQVEVVETQPKTEGAPGKVDIEEDYFPDFLKDPDALNENITKLSKKREARTIKKRKSFDSDNSFEWYI